MSTQSVGTLLALQRQAILQRRRDLYHHKRQVIFAEDSSNQRQLPQPHRLPRFDDPELIAKMRGFHDSLAALQSERYCVCLEQFPNMAILMTVVVANVVTMTSIYLSYFLQAIIWTWPCSIRTYCE